MDARTSVCRASWLSALVLLAALAMALESCGSSTTTAWAGPQRSKVSTSTGTATATMTPPAHRSGAVTLSVGQAHFASSATIVIVVHNAGSTDIYAREQSTSCSMILLQRLVNGVWQPVSPCLDGFPHSTISTVAPGSAVSVELAPQSASSVEGEGGSGTAWPSGTYRAALSYTASQSANFGQGTLVYSDTFSVG